MNLSSVEHKHLIAVTAARFTHESDPPEIIEVWLHWESVTVSIGVAADWELQVMSDEPGESYTMEELAAVSMSFPLPMRFSSCGTSANALFAWSRDSTAMIPPSARKWSSRSTRAR